MPYDANILRRATQRLEEESRRRREQVERKRIRAYENAPRLEQLDRQIQGTMAGLVAAALRQGSSPVEAVRSVREENQSLQRERAVLLGAMGLPGDLSSPSRFVKAAFTKLNSACGSSEAESVSQFFHILGSVTQQRGCVQVAPGQYMTTLYTSCCNMDTGVYYYTTYGNSQISGVDLHRENLEGSALVTYPLLREQQIHMQN